MYRTLISTASALALLAGAAHAQDSANDDGVTHLDVITVTANRTPTEKSKTGSKVEQVTQAEIEAKSLSTIADYLIRLPGVFMTSNGGVGTNSNLYIRGLPGGYVKTFYNGIDLADTTGIQVATPYEYPLTGGVTGIEVLKGSQGTLYGSNAIAGVVDLTTLGGIEDGVSHRINVEGGSLGTVRGHYGFSGAKDGSKVAANVSGFRTDGISAFAGGSEPDGYQNTTLDLAVEHRINDAFSVFGSVLHIDAEADFDDFGADSAYNQTLTTILAGRAGFNVDLLDGRWKHTFAAQAFRMDRDSVENPLTSTFGARREKFDYQSSFEISDRILLQYGADHERQVAETATPDWSAFPPVALVDARNAIKMSGAWAQASFEPIDDLVVTAGLRHDKHSEFGGHTTWRATGSYRVPGTDTRLHSSVGTGFRAPSLYQLYDPSYGNPSLDPETSASFDFGVEQKFLDGRLSADITYFRAEIENLIGFDSASGYVQVPGTTISEGVEASFDYAATHWLNLGGAYTYTDSRAASGTRTSGVPKHALVLSATVLPAEKWTVGADLRFVADRVDRTGVLKDYVLLDAKVAYQLTENTQVYVRGENLLNRKYEIVRDYGTPGIAAFAGLKAKF